MNKCEYCNGNLVELIESTKLDDLTYWWNDATLAKQLDIEDNSVMFEVRNGAGYIRLGDRKDMQCLDHEQKLKTNYCFNCGRKLVEE
jgi:hypothetical protein